MIRLGTPWDLLLAMIPPRICGISPDSQRKPLLQAARSRPYPFFMSAITLLTLTA